MRLHKSSVISKIFPWLIGTFLQYQLRYRNSFIYRRNFIIVLLVFFLVANQTIGSMILDAFYLYFLCFFRLIHFFSLSMFLIYFFWPFLHYCAGQLFHLQTNVTYFSNNRDRKIYIKNKTKSKSKSKYFPIILLFPPVHQGAKDNFLTYKLFVTVCF